MKIRIYLEGEKSSFDTPKKKLKHRKEVSNYIEHIIIWYYHIGKRIVNTETIKSIYTMFISTYSRCTSSKQF